VKTHLLVILVSTILSTCHSAQAKADECKDARNAFLRFEDKSSERFTRAVNSAPPMKDAASAKAFYQALCKAHTDNIREFAELRQLLFAAVNACNMAKAEADSWLHTLDQSAEAGKKDQEEYCNRSAGR